MLNKICIIGGGTMGEILLQGVLKHSAAADISIAESQPQRAEYLTQTYAVTAGPLKPTMVEEANVLVLAVKPQDYTEVGQMIRDSLHGQLIFSVMAGVGTKKLSIVFKSARVIRCMPNTPAKIGYGMTVWTDTIETTDADRSWTVRLLESFGTQLYMTNDDLIDKATAINGSGPAYVFLFAEELLAAAKIIGLDEDQAHILVTETIRGAGELLVASKITPAELRAQVTSKKGTTDAALSSLPYTDLQNAWITAVQAAYARAKELSA